MYVCCVGIYVCCDAMYLCMYALMVCMYVCVSTQIPMFFPLLLCALLQALKQHIFAIPLCLVACRFSSRMHGKTWALRALASGGHSEGRVVASTRAPCSSRVPRGDGSVDGAVSRLRCALGSDSHGGYSNTDQKEYHGHLTVFS